jgi:hypothetical protein
VTGPNGQLELQNVVNFSPPTLSGNTSEFGEYIAKLQAAGSSPALAGTVAQLFNAPNAKAVSALYRELSPTSFGPMEASTLIGTLGFSQSMLGCKSPESGFGSLAKGGCTWGSLGSSQLTQSETNDAVGYSEYSQGVSYGFQNPINRKQNWLLGGAFSYDDDNLYADSASMWGSRFSLGVLSKLEANDGVTYSADVSLGSGNYQTRRSIIFPSSTVSTSAGTSGYGSFTTPNSTPTGGAYVSFFGETLRADKDFRLHDGFVLTPYVAVNETRMSMTPTNEAGAGPNGIFSVYQGNSYLTLQPGFELGGTFNSNSWQFRPHVDVYATQFIGSNLTNLNAGLEGAPSTFAPFTFTNTMDRTMFNVSPTVDLGGKNGFDLRVGGGYEFSNHMHSGTLTVNLAQKIGTPPPMSLKIEPATPALPQH